MKTQYIVEVMIETVKVDGDDHVSYTLDDEIVDTVRCDTYEQAQTIADKMIDKTGI